MAKNRLSYTVVDSPVGELVLASSPKGLAAVLLPGKGKPLDRLRKRFSDSDIDEDLEPNRNAVEQIRGYFSGERKTFDLLLDMRGTPFQLRVLKAVSKVPYGKTRSYGNIARTVGKPKAFRAVGNTNRTNPIPIVIPCHRIVGSDGSLTGYGGGIPLKAALLRLERSFIYPRLCMHNRG